MKQTIDQELNNSIIKDRFTERVELIKHQSGSETLEMFSNFLKDYLINPSDVIAQSEFKDGWIVAVDTIQKILKTYAEEARK